MLDVNSLLCIEILAVYTNFSKRKAYLKEAKQLDNPETKTAAYAKYRTAFNITPHMAYKAIKQLRKMQVMYLVAPYEADAQLAYLAMNNYVDAVFSVDSDILIYGSPIVIKQIDKLDNIEIVEREDVFEMDELRNADDVTLKKLCILGGCDYFDNIKGYRLKSLLKLYNKLGDIDSLVDQLLSDKEQEIKDRFQHALLTFNHQRVYNPESKSMVPLNPIPEDAAESKYIGDIVDAETICKVAEGYIHPVTKEPYEAPPPKVKSYAVFSNGVNETSVY